MADLAKIGVPYQGLGVMARRSLVERNPDLAERSLRAMVETIAYINNPNNKAAVMRSLAKDLRLSKVEDAQAGYDMMKTLYDRRIYPNVDGLRNVIRLLASSSEPNARISPVWMSITIPAAPIAEKVVIASSNSCSSAC